MNVVFDFVLFPTIWYIHFICFTVFRFWRQKVNSISTKAFNYLHQEWLQHFLSLLICLNILPYNLIIFLFLNTLSISEIKEKILNYMWIVYWTITNKWICHVGLMCIYQKKKSKEIFKIMINVFDWRKSKFIRWIEYFYVSHFILRKCSLTQWFSMSKKYYLPKIFLMNEIFKS